MIRWITESVVASECFDQILISTDDDRIFDAVADLEVERHIRPEQHATTRATVLDAMIDLMGEVDGFKIFSYFLPTSPFIGIEDIKKGIDFFKDQSIDSVIGMTLMPAPIQLACIMSNDDVLPVFDNLECGLTNSKFIKKYYKPSGFYMSRWDNLLKHKNFFKGRVKGVIMSPERCIDIDTIEDINHAESTL